MSRQSFPAATGNEIAVIAMAGRLPGAGDVEQLWRNLRAGTESLSRFSAEELLAAGEDPVALRDPNYVPVRGVVEGIEEFDAGFFGYGALEAELTDPQQRLLLECSWEALEQAGYDSERYRRPVGVYVGMGTSSYALDVLADPVVLRAVGAQQALLLSDRDFCAGRISYKLGLTGPSLVVQTACSTSLVAVHVACQALLAGECELALAGGVSIKVPQRHGYLYQEGGINSPDGRCRAFDAGAQGTVSGSGVGIVALKRLADAQADGDHVFAVIKATAINNDGAGKIGFTAPSIEGQRKVIRAAHALAEVDIGTIGYVEAHGTATPLGDPIEFAALCEAFQQVRERRGSCAIGSLKTNVGHLDTAAGVAGLIKVVLALYHQEIPPSLHFHQANPAIDLSASPFYVNTALVPWPAHGAPRRAGVSAFGIGGTNAHVVLEEAPAAPAAGPSRPWQLLVLSARSGPSLGNAAGALAERLAAQPDLDLADVAYTLQVGRRRFAHRRVAVVEDARDAVATLRSLAPDRVWSRAAAATATPVVFLFPGQGSQYVDMARGLYEGEPLFRAGLERCAELLAPELGTDLREVLYPHAERRPEAAAALRSSALAQPALFAVEHSLAGLWMDWGIQPEAMLGHSVGELVAACLAGVFGLADGLRLSAARGRLMQAMAPGAMLSVALPEPQVSSLLGDHPELALAAVNGASLCAISGPPPAIAALERSLTEAGISWRRLHVSHGFHSASMAPAVAPFVEVVRRIELRPPARPFISNVTGRWIEDREATSPAYWGEHLRRTVRFADGMKELLREPERAFLEVGPGRTLTTLVRQQSVPAAGVAALSCLRHPRERAADQPRLLSALGRLWLAGAPVDWAAFSRQERRRRVPLPTYPFERQRYWHEPSARAGAATAAAPAAEASAEAAALAGAPAAAGGGLGHARPDLETPYLPPRTAAEHLVARVWGELLGLAAVGIHDDFFELGGHSLLATRVVARLRQETGIEVPLRELLENPTVAGAAVWLAPAPGRDRSAAAAAELPRIVPDGERRHEPFPLTEMQQAYWIGRRGDLELGGVGTHAFWEIDFAGLDLARFERALARLIAHHDMLRAVFQPDGLQRILATVPPYRLGTLDLRRLPASRTGPGLAQVRRRMSHQVLPSDRWPLFEIRVSLLPGGRVRLHVSLDFLITDAWSWQLICDQVARLYLQPGLPLAPLAISFRDYVLAEVALAESPLHHRALAYWRGRLADLPGPPELPRPRRTAPGALSRFGRRRGRLDADEWGRLKLRAARHGLTPSAVLMAAFCEVLAAWSKSRRFVLHLTLFNRLPLHPEVPRLVGDFTSLILLEVDATGRASFEMRARRLQQRLWQDLEQRYVSGVRVLRELAQLHGRRPSAAMPIVFTSTLHLEGEAVPAAAAAAAATPALSAEAVYGISQTPQVLLDHQVGETAGALDFNWDAVEDAFPPGLLDEMFSAYRELLARLGTQAEVWRETVLTTDPERPPAVPASEPGAAGGERLETLFAARARVAGDRPAVISPDRTVTYAELAGRASALARRLSALAPGHGQRIAVVMEKGWEQVVAVLAVLEAGAAYLPVEAALPAARRRELLAQAGAAVVLTQEKLTDLAGWPDEVAVLAAGVAEASGPPGPAVDRRRAEDLAYVIYTSGSTGVPKGVMIDHRAAVNTIRDVNRRFEVGETDRVLAVSALGFDLSVYDIFGLLAAGGAVVVPPAQASPDPAVWAELLARHRVTIWNSVPALFELLLEHLAQHGERLPASLRLVLLSGDWIPLGLPARARSLGGRLELVSLGGATEAAIWSVLYPIGEVEASWPSIPYGRPLANQRLHVLDEELAKRPAWAVGELYIAGAGLARGYLNDEERTAAAFVVHPRTGERMYRTGDLARRLPDGELEFLGRDDTQVKIQGFRIELGEIESALGKHPAVAACAVAAPGERERRRLAAYVVWRPERGAADAGELRGFLAERLPSYMVPAVYVSLAGLPLTANGKVDRLALPDPDTRPAAGEDRPAPASAIQELLAGIWAAVLEREQVGPEENFFELGGQSLLATRVLGRVREVFGVEVPLRTLFESPTVAALAAAITAARGAGSLPSGPRLEARAHGGEVPLSYAQQRLWFLDRLEPGSAAYLMPFALRLAGRLAVAALGRSLDEVVGRHDVLRTAVVVTEAGPAGRVAPPLPLALPLVDLGALAAPARARERTRVLAQDASRPFDLSRAPLLRALLLRCQADDHALLLNLHHMATDGWSMAVLVRELTAAYAAFAAGRPPSLPALAIQYADYALWQRHWLAAGALDEQLACWRQRLAAFDGVLELPTDRPRPAVQTSAGATLSLPLSGEVLRCLQAMSRDQAVTLFMTLVGVFQVLLARTTGQQDVAIGTPIAGRRQVETEKLIGLFVNSLVLRTSLAGDPPFSQLLGRIRNTTLEAYTNQDLPFDRLVEELQPQRDLSRTPLFQVMFDLRQAPLGAVAAPELRLEPLSVGTGAAQFELSLTAGEAGGAWEVDAEYNRDLFDATTVRRLLRHFEMLLHGVAAEPHARLSELPLLGAGERHQLLVEWNDTAVPVSNAMTLHGLFAARAAQSPDAVALISEAGSLTYRELDTRAGRLAHRLRALGIGTEDRVGIQVSRSTVMAVGILGALKSGAAYVPLDPTYPQERLQFLVADSELSALLTEERLAGVQPADSVPRILLDTEPAEPAGARIVGSPGEALPGSAAYVIYTSGSTGLPKGAMVAHAPVVNFALEMARQLGLGPGDRMLQFASLSFDVLVEELFPIWLAGGAVVLHERDLLLAVHDLEAVVDAHQVTAMELPAPYWQEWVYELETSGRRPPRSLRLVLVGSEKPSPERLAAWGRLGVPLINVYGLTETTITSSLHRARLGAGATAADLDLPIGRPLANTRLYVLDRQLRPVPWGVPGELYIGGAGVARGYHGRPALTAERFVPDPFAGEPGERLYRTGDLARYRRGGELEFLGRLDAQVKVRGFRVELGEIEAALRRHPAVRDAAVAMRGGRLVGYVVPAAPAAELSWESLRGFLQAALPEPLVPGAFVRLAALPLSANGKLDRRALPEAEAAPAEAGRFLAPRTPLEQLLAGIWCEVLGVQRVGVEDGFFALGGHSLLATRLISRVRATFGLELPLQALFQAQVLGAFAAAVEAAQRRGPGGAAPPPITRVSRGGELPLSFAQQRLWFLDQLEPARPTYNVPLAARLTGTLRVAALAAALVEVVRRHEVLRTRFPAVDGRPVQCIAASVAPALPVVDLSGLEAPGREAEARRLARREASLPFDLARGALLRARLVALGAADHLVLATLHHIVCDGWSLDVLLAELSVAYDAALLGRPSPLPELAVQYADFASWQRLALSDEVLESQLAYWRERLAGCPAVLDLPTDRPRPPVLSWRGAWQRLALSRELAGDLERLARQETVTLFMVLAAGFQALLGRWSGVRDVVVGTAVANRTRVELEGLIGFFANTLVLRARVEGCESFHELLGQVRQTALGAYAHQDVPFERLVEELSPERNLGQTPLFQVLMVLQEGGGVPRLHGLTLTEMEVETASAKFDLTLQLQRDDGELSVALEYRTELFDGTTARRLLDHWQRLLAGLTADPGRAIGELPLLGAAERHQLVREWSDTAAVWPPGGGKVHQLVAARAAAAPERVAVARRAAALTYGALTAWVHRFARHLRRLGVGRGAVVGVCLDRPLELPAVLLGILETGAAYLPLDPSQPPRRLGFLADDAGARWLVAEGEAAGPAADRTAALASPGRRLIDLGRVAAEISGEIAGAVAGDPAAVAPLGAAGTIVDADLAYVMYTSGSTGQPKGVGISHGALANLLLGILARLPAGPETRLLALTPLTFDIAGLEIYLPLLAGGRVVLAPRDAAWSGELLVEEWQRAGATAVQATPATWGMLLAAGWPAGLPGVALCGGEEMAPPLAAALTARATAAWNLYGPTETTVWSALSPAAPGSDGRVPLGRPLANTEIYILDRWRQLLPPNAVGELCIGGAGVARGYAGRPELTAESFVPDPFSGRPGARLYVTGDLARQRPDGTLCFLGRRDHQLKVRGHRIEPGEVEAALLGHPGVAEAVVVAREGPGGDRRLVGYLVPRGAPPPAAALRSWLGQRVPAYMVPSEMVFLGALPVTPNGKIDRHALPAPAGRPADEAAAAAAPQGETEELLASIWSAVLGRGPNAASDDFFDLGGHSLLAVQLVARVRQVFGVELPLPRVFAAPRLGDQVREIALAAAAGSPPLRPIPVRRRAGEALPVSFAQEGLWFLSRLDPGSASYNLTYSVALEGQLDAAALHAALHALAARHEPLRTTFTAVQGRVCQRIAPAGPIAMPRVDLAALPAAARQAVVHRLASDEARRPFDLAAGPLLRFTLLGLAPARHLALVSLHHIIADGWSMDILVRDLGACYRAATGAGRAGLPPLPVQYADYAAWQRQVLDPAGLAAELASWRTRLAGAPPLLEVPADHPRTAAAAPRGAYAPVALDRALSGRLRQLGSSAGCTLFMVLLAGWKTLLLRHTGQADLVVGAVLANRQRLEIEELIGLFANTLPLRTDAGGNPSFRQLLDRVRETALHAYAHGEVPFERLVEDLQPRRDLRHSPLVQVVMVLHQAPPRAAALPRLALRFDEIQSGAAKFDLNLALAAGAEGIGGSLEYNRDLFEPATAARLLGHLRNLLAAGAAAPELPVWELPLLSAPERHQLSLEWGTAEQVAGDGESSGGLHRRFERQAARALSATAAVCGSEHVSYGELEARANRLARHLRELGAGPGTLVGLCLERSLDLPVAILATLKVGAAYVPLDPSYPAERLAFMVLDSRIPVVITRLPQRSRLPATGVRHLDLDADAAAIAAQPTVPLGLEVPAAAPAYVIYTSGSTGSPKGCVVSHGNVAHLFAGSAASFGFGPADTWTLFHSFAFDFSVWELWGALLHGGRLVVVPYWVSRSPAAFYELLARERVTVLNQTPSAFRQLILAEEGGGAGGERLTLRLVIFGGESLDLGSLAPWFERHGDAEPLLVNMYGITETTVHVTRRPLAAGDLALGRRSPLGAPLPGLAVELVDRRLRPVPLGVAGEIVVRGGGLAMGYLGRPELTAERFVPDPGGTPAGGRIYRSGDLARRRPDGEIEYLGRLDHQLKIRGFRVEPAEIEAALDTHPGVREAVVVARRPGRDTTRLVAYLVAHPAGPVPAGELRRYLLDRLPEHMVPTGFMWLEALPLTPNGKLDRRALPPASAPDPAAVVAAAPTPPRVPLERQLAAIWSEVLGIPEPGVHDSFFELGGDSILAIQMVARAHQAGLDLTPRQVFEHQTIAALAGAVRPAGPPGGEAGPISGPVPLAPIQRRFFSWQLAEPGHWNQSLLLAARQPLEPRSLAQALAAVLEHHDALRHRFAAAAGEVRQVCAPPGGPLPLSLIDLQALAAGRWRPAVEQAAAACQAGLDLAAGPLLRAVLFAGGDRPGRLLLVVHHLVVDGVSWRVLLEDLVTAYQQATSGRPISLPAKTTSYQRWAELLAEPTGTLAAETELWARALAGRARRLPLDDPGAANLEGGAEEVVTALDPLQTRELLRAAPVAFRAGLQELLLTCCALALCSWTGSRRVLLDLEGHGRVEQGEGIDLSRTVGWFTAIYPMALDLKDATSIMAALGRVKEQLRAVPRGGIGYDQLRFAASGPALVPPGADQVPEVCFNYLGQLDQALPTDGPFGLAEESAGPYRSPRQERRYRLELDSSIFGGRLRLRWTYGPGHRRETIERLAAGCDAALRELAELGRAPQPASWVPADFPLARLDRQDLDRVLACVRQVEDVYRLSPAQQGLLFHALADPAGGLYVYQATLQLASGLDVQALAGAWAQVVARHAVLRTGFLWQGIEEPLQVVVQQVAVPVACIDWRGLRAAAQERLLAELLADDRRRRFELSRPPLARLLVVHLGEEAWRLVWSCHHLIVDGWSVANLARELVAIYQARRDGRESALDRPRPYRSFIAWLRQQDLAAAEGYWRRVLAGFTRPVPVGAPPGPDAGRGCGEHRLRVPAATADALAERARRQGLTPATLALGAWALLLAARSARRDVVFGNVVAGRPPELAGSERMVGMFISVLPLRVRIEPDAPLAGWLAELQQQQAQAQGYAFVPLVELRRWSEVPAGLPLFESTFAFNNYPTEVPHRGGNAAGGDLQEVEQTSYALDLTVAMRGDLSLRVMYDRGRFAPAAIERLASDYAVLLGALAQEPPRCLGDGLALLSRAEPRRSISDQEGRVMPAFNRFKGVVPKPVGLPTEDAVEQDHLRPGQSLPLVLHPRAEEVDLAEWVEAHRELLARQLLRHGAVLCRGFAVTAAATFERIAKVLAPDLFDDNGEHVRESVDGKVYTPVFFAPDKKLLWHNENSFNHRWPLKIFFCCLRPAAAGGETPIVDSREVYRRLDPAIRQRFEEHGIMYVRNYGHGVGLDWRQVLSAATREQAEARCRESVLDFEWQGDRLRTRALRPAVVRHPRTGEMSWFNQAQHWHVSCLDRETRESVETLFAPEDLPRNCYYGDGQPIADRDMAEILKVYAELEVVFPWQAGDVLICDNLLTAHARNPFSGERKLLVAMGEMTSFDELGRHPAGEPQDDA
jgi:amino acid adenylation domain-containing protein/non-ribosomal peptide synthase protein (TIGR01720 family)